MKKTQTVLTANSFMFVFNNVPHNVPSSHDNYYKIVEEVVVNNNPELAIQMLKPVKILESCKIKDITINGDSVFFKGEDISSESISSKILDFVRNNHPIDALNNFLERLGNNPSYNSRKQLYKFLEHTGMPITPDGYFLAYKGVNAEMKDCYTNSFDNSIGAVLEMPRQKVNDNPNEGCSYGFHAGSLEYARNFGAVCVVVKIDPADVVSVPHDSNNQKLRTCKYEVIGVHKNTRIHLNSDYLDYAPIFQMPIGNNGRFIAPEEDEYEEDEYEEDEYEEESDEEPF